MSETLREIEELTNAGYQYGFSTDLDTDIAPPGLSEDVGAADLGQEERAPVAARLAAEGVPALARRWTSPTGRTLQYRARSTTRRSATRRRRRRSRLDSIDEVDPEIREMYDKLGIPLHEQKLLTSVAVDAIFDSVSVGTTFKASSPRPASSSARSAKRCSDHPDLVREVPRLGGSVRDNYLRRTQLGGLLRRVVRLHPQGRALPDGAVDVLPHQRGRHRPVRAHADRRRRRLVRVSYLEGCTAPKRDDQPAPCGRRRDWSLEDAPRSSTRPCRTGTPATRTVSAASTTSSPSAAGRTRTQDLLDAGRDRLGDHLEVPERDPAGRPTPSASSTRWRSPTSASRPTRARR